MKTITSAQMFEIDRLASEHYGISSLTLMENAGQQIAGVLTKNYPAASILLLCGPGHNGGDGLVAARYLKEKGHPVRVLFPGDISRLKPDTEINYRRCLASEISCETELPAADRAELIRFFQKADVLVDALFGIGLSRPLEGPFRRTIQALYEIDRPVVAVDIPSGLNADTGEPCGDTVRAVLTLTLGAAKTGLLAGQGPGFCGHVTCLDIGLPPALLREYGL